MVRVRECRYCQQNVACAIVDGPGNFSCMANKLEKSTHFRRLIEERLLPTRRHTLVAPPEARYHWWGKDVHVQSSIRVTRERVLSASVGARDIIGSFLGTLAGRGTTLSSTPDNPDLLLNQFRPFSLASISA